MFLSRVLHPFLFGIWPILFLIAENIGEMAFARAVTPLAAVLVIVAALFWLPLWLGISRYKIGLQLSAFLVAFFSFGYIVRLVPESLGQTTAVGFAVTLSLLGLLLVGILLGRSRRTFEPATRAMNLVASVLVIWQLFHIGWAELSRTGAEPLQAAPIETTATNTALPDIYYIIPDGYGRSDVLAEIFSYNNAEFVAFLRGHGFFVADSACANYCQTLLSLSSSLNLDYLQSLYNLWPNDRDRTPLIEHFAQARVFRLLRDRGYEIQAYQTGSEHTEFPSADRFLQPTRAANEFETLLLSTTPLPYLFPSRYSQYDFHRRRIDFTLNSLSRSCPGRRPKFVLAHIIAPHPPFVYGRAGERIEPDRPYSMADGSVFELFGGAAEEYVCGYRDQVEFVTGRLRESIGSLLDNYGDRPPVILLQSDHGPGSRTQFNLSRMTDLHERMSILNALLVPGVDPDLLYPHLSPVNSFRIVFNTCFGDNYPLLSDSVFWSPFNYPYDFENVTARVR